MCIRDRLKTGQMFTVKHGIYKKAIRKVALPDWVKRVIVDDSKQGAVDLTKVSTNRNTLYIHNNTYLFRKPRDEATTKLKFSDDKIYEVSTLTSMFGSDKSMSRSIKKALKTAEVSDKDKNVFAEVVGNHIFFHVDWLSPFPYTSAETSLDKDEALELLTILLTEAVKHISNDVDIKSVKDNIEKYVFIDIAKKQIKKEIEAKKEAIKKDADMLERLRKELADLTRRMNLNIKYLKSSQELSKEVEERAEKTYNKMKSMKGVKDVKVSSDGSVTIIAGPFVLQKDKKKYNLGDYRIVIKDTNVTIRNLRAEELKIDEDHPHIRQDGARTHICWGNWAPVTEHIARYEYDVALAYILMLLRSWNPEDTFIDLEALARELKIKPE